MPNPQQAFGFNLSDGSEISTINPANESTRLSHEQRQSVQQGRASHRQSHIASANDQTTIPAIPTNVHLSFAPTGSTGPLSGPYVTSHPETSAANTYLDQSTAATSLIGSSNRATFGSQPLPTTSAPQLAFAPQPVYELTGELAYEPVSIFDRLNDISNPQESNWQAFDAQADYSSLQSHNSSSGKSVNIIDSNLPKSALKRKYETAISLNLAEDVRKKQQLEDISSDSNKARRVAFERMSSVNATSYDEASSSEDEPSGRQQSQQTKQSRLSPNPRRNRNETQFPTESPRSQGIAATTSQQHATANRTVSAHPTALLPPEKVFPIQIGSELFRLSGASISSDAPSYFTQFFEDQIKQLEESGGVRTLYIDRDPETFRDIARHLQGYYVKPRDGTHFVKLFADAQFYQLPRLIDQLFESEIFIQIGEQHFQIPKDVFTDPGNSPNFFSLGFAVFFSSPGEVFPGLDRRGLLRPPPITPPYVPGRSANTFAQLLHLLRGYPLNIENESHRAELLRDCRYFHLRGLEQKIIAHEISYNLAREKKEICIRIEDIKPSGISYKADDNDEGSVSSSGWVLYARPFVDDAAYELIVEISGESAVLDVNSMRLDFQGLAKARVSSLLQVVANKMNLPTKAPLGLMVLSGGSSSHAASPGNTPLSEDRVKTRIEPATDINLDGEPFDVDWTSPLGQLMQNGQDQAVREYEESESTGMSDTSPQQGASFPASQQTFQNKRKRRRLSSATNTDRGKWVIRSGQWRLRVESSPQDTGKSSLEIVFVAVKLDAFSNERARNMRRRFLSGA